MTIEYDSEVEEDLPMRSWLAIAFAVLIGGCILWVASFTCRMARKVRLALKIEREHWIAGHLMREIRRGRGEL